MTKKAHISFNSWRQERRQRLQGRDNGVPGSRPGQWGRLFHRLQRAPVHPEGEDRGNDPGARLPQLLPCHLGSVWVVVLLYLTVPTRY